MFFEDPAQRVDTIVGVATSKIADSNKHGFVYTHWQMGKVPCMPTDRNTDKWVWLTRIWSEVELDYDGLICSTSSN